MATPYAPNSHKQRMEKRRNVIKLKKLRTKLLNVENSMRWDMADRAELLRSGHNDVALNTRIQVGDDLIGSIRDEIHELECSLF